MAVDPAVLKELQDWKAFRDSLDPSGFASWDPATIAKYNGDTLSPTARAYTVGRVDPATGKPATGVDGQHFDVQKGQVVNNGGLWSLPETYAIMAAAAGLGGVAAFAAPAADSPAFLAAGGESASTGGVAGGAGAAGAAGGAGAAGSTASLLKQLGGTAGLGTAGISALATLLGTNMQTSANTQAAEANAAALKYGADLTDAASKRSEAFLRAQAESGYQNAEATRKANYGQWAAREQRVSNLGAALGLAPRTIPGYVPGVDPNLNTWNPNDYAPGTTPPNTGAPAPGSTPAPTTSTWDPNKFAAIVGRPPTAAETSFYSTVPTWETDVRNAAGGGAPTTPGAYGPGYRG